MTSNRIFKYIFIILTLITFSGCSSVSDYATISIPLATQTPTAVPIPVSTIAPTQAPPLTPTPSPTPTPTMVPSPEPEEKVVLIAIDAGIRPREIPKRNLSDRAQRKPRQK